MYFNEALIFLKPQFLFLWYYGLQQSGRAEAKPSMTNLKRQVVGGIDLAICCLLVNFLPLLPAALLAGTSLLLEPTSPPPNFCQELLLAFLDFTSKSVVNTHLLLLPPLL